MTALAPLDAYRLLAPTYDEQLNPLLALEQRTTAALLPPLAGRTVADVAAGTGRWARYCRDAGAFAIAIDFCREMIERAPAPRLLGDARHLPLRDASVDLVILSFGLGYAPECLPELARVTRSGGSVIVSDTHPNALRNGWRRGFRVGDHSIEVASRPYEIGSLSAAGLRLAALAEPHFGDPERRIFEEAGKLDSFDASQPALFVARLEKP